MRPLYIAILLAAFGCGSAKKKSTMTDDGTTASGQFRVTSQWVLPLVGGGDKENLVTLAFTRSSGEAVSSVRLTGFHPRMPTHGHGTVETKQKFSPGAKPNEVTVSGICFIMAGPAQSWVVNIVAEVDGAIDSVTLPIPYEVKE